MQELITVQDEQLESFEETIQTLKVKETQKLESIKTKQVIFLLYFVFLVYHTIIMKTFENGCVLFAYILIYINYYLFIVIQI